MYSICNEYVKFYSACQKTEALFKQTPHISEPKERFISATGVINHIWQSWNRFWRNYWLTFLYGGTNLCKRSLPVAIVPRTLDEMSAISHFLVVSGIRSRPLRGYFQEPTWGDIDFILKCALAANTLHPMSGFGTPVLNAFSVVGNTPKHFQIVRNASVHFCGHSMKDVQANIVPHYLISKLVYPTDIIFSKELVSKKQAINLWLDDLKAAIELTTI